MARQAAAGDDPQRQATARRPGVRPGGEDRAGAPGLWPTPWLDRRGRPSALRIATLLILCLPALAIGVDWAMGAFSPDTMDGLTHASGLWSIRILVASLAVTPLGTITGWQKLFQVRRMIGVAALLYALAHLGFFTALQGFDIGTVAAEIVKRPYLLIGFAALVGLVVLGWTSNDGALLRMGRSWKRLHRLVFPIAVLAAVHFFLQSKVDVSEAVFTTGLFLWLVGWRLLPRLWRTRVVVLLALSVAAGLGTAGIEYLWYVTATGIPAHRVLAANWSVAAGIRPGVSVALWGFVAGLLALVPRLLPKAATTPRRVRGAP